MWTHLFSRYPRQNLGTVPVPEYKVSTLYSGSKLGTESLCEHIFRWCPGTLPTNHLFSYPQFLVPLEISIVSACSVYWMWTYLQTGYRVSKHSTILCWRPGTSARAPGVNTAWVVLLIIAKDNKIETQLTKNNIQIHIKLCFNIKRSINQPDTVWLKRKLSFLHNNSRCNDHPPRSSRSWVDHSRA